MFDYLELLDQGLKEGIGSIFSHPLIGNMGKYIYRSHISGGNYYINFADAPIKINHDPGRIYRYGKKINDPVMTAFATYLFKDSNPGKESTTGTISERLGNLFKLKDWQEVPPGEPLVKDFYFPDWDVVTAREMEGSSNGLYFTAKGGSNHEQHNHNDVGSFMLYYDGKPVFIDVGVGTYTRETFSPERYSIWTMQSNYHNLPLINGTAQSAGGNFEASGSTYVLKKDRVHYTTYISSAYPVEAAVNRWERTYIFKRNKGLEINDVFELEENNGKTSFHLMSANPVELIAPGLLETTGEGFTIQTRFDPEKLTASVETILIDDPRLLQNHGEKLYRIVFKWTGEKLKGNVNLTIAAKN